MIAEREDLLVIANQLPAPPQSVFPVKWGDWRYQQPYTLGGIDTPGAFERVCWFEHGSIRVTATARVEIIGPNVLLDICLEAADAAMIRAKADLEQLYEAVRRQQAIRKPTLAVGYRV